MQKNHSLLLVLFAFALFSCGNKKESAPEIKTVETVSEPKEYVSEEITAEFKEPAMAAVFDKYVELKTTLVNSNAKATVNAAMDLKKVLQASQTGEDAETAVQKIIDAESLEAQRSAFSELSSEIEKALQNALEEGTIYKQYCPMAFNNTGAYWLSESKDIMNPYFGDKMLKCGRVDSEIK